MVEPQPQPTPRALEAREEEAAARDELAAFAAFWARTVYGSSPFFGELREHLDGYRDAVEARVRRELQDGRGSQSGSSPPGEQRRSAARRR